MADFPYTPIHKPTISSLGKECVGLAIRLLANYASAAATWTTVNSTVYLPLTLLTPFLVKKVWWLNSTAVAGNVDVGVYAVSGARVLSSGATLMAGTSAAQSVTLGTAVLVTPGSYYLALCATSTSAIFRGGNGLSRAQSSAVGALGQSSTTALPTAATFAQCPTSQTIPVFGISRASVI